MKLYVTHDIRLGILDKENVPFLCLMNKDLKTTYRIPYVRFFKPAETTVEPEI